MNSSLARPAFLLAPFLALPLLSTPTPAQEPQARSPAGPPAAPSTAPQEPDARAPELSPGQASNRPPYFERLPPYLDKETVIAARTKKNLRFVVHGVDPDGGALTYQARALPEGATFDAYQQVFQWTPTEAQVGSYSPLFFVSDGARQASLAVLIEVNQNQPPAVRPKHHELEVSHASRISLAVSDPDGDALSYSAKGLPQGAQLDRATGIVRFTPLPSQVGVHTFLVTVSDGEAEASFETNFDVQPDTLDRAQTFGEWESFLQPGVGYAVYGPHDRDSLGVFHGANLELTFISWIHRNDNRGPSHGRIYMKGEILQSTRDAVSQLFAYSLGTTLSLERNPTRKWLIPHYGVEFGGLTQEDIGGAFQSTAFFGVHAWAGPNLFVNLDFGYRLVPKDMPHLGGWRASSTIDFSFW